MGEDQGCCRHGGISQRLGLGTWKWARRMGKGKSHLEEKLARVAAWPWGNKEEDESGARMEKKSANSCKRNLGKLKENCQMYNRCLGLYA